MYKKIIRPILFKFDPECIHRIVSVFLKIPILLKILKLVYDFQSPDLARNVCGVKFRNPLGLAAGFDKDAELVNQMADLGFGYVEIGTVTPQGQPGNEKPRLFRLPKDVALINRMGFNNSGVENVRKNLLKLKRKCVVGGNIGKNKSTPNEKAVNDYLVCFNRLYDVVDYFVINVSSPNTPGLRELQEKDTLTEILSCLQEQNQAKNRQKPIFLKISPDLDEKQLDDIIEVVLKTNIAGIIATNTTIARNNLKTDSKEIERIGSGGLSGRPVRKSSTQIIRYLVKKSQNAFPVIGVGGITSPEDVLEKLNAGASLVQIYTGFIYEGPGLIKRINKYLLHSFTNKSA
jgi:dihydroorotate dehydrogenase